MESLSTHLNMPAIYY